MPYLEHEVPSRKLKGGSLLLWGHIRGGNLGDPMAKILKPYEVPLDATLAQEILDIPLDAVEGPLPTTIGERVKAACLAVEEANTYLKNSKLALLVADSLMRQLKRRGIAFIRLRSDGQVVLFISYDRQEQETPKAQSLLVTRKNRKSDLPSLKDLRDKAASLGLDVSGLGRQRRAIHKLIQAMGDVVAAPSLEEEEEELPPEPGIEMIPEAPRPKTRSKKPKLDPPPELQPEKRTILRKGGKKDAVVEEMDLDDLLEP